MIALTGTVSPARSAIVVTRLLLVLAGLDLQRPCLAQTVIGESHALAGRQTPHPYAPADVRGDVVWSDAIQHKGATFIKVWFTDFSLARNDYVIVRDADSKQAHRYDWTKPQRKFWSASILADNVVVELHSVADVGGHGFAIGGYAQGHFPAGAAGGIVCPYFALCGANEECSADGNLPPGLPCHPALPPRVCGYPGPDGTAYALRRPVFALIYADCPDQDPDNAKFVYQCSGYQIDGDECLVLTSKHCQPPSFCGGWEAGAAECWFNAEATGCVFGTIKPIDRYLVLQELCCSTCKNDSPLCASCARPPNAPPDPFLDYSLLRIAPIADAPPCTFYGQLPLAQEPPRVGEPVYRHHHSWGCQKQYSQGVITAEDDLWPDYVFYDAIGAGGSSGSPVISAVDHRVVVHHGYVGGAPDIIGCTVGKGSTMSAVRADLIAQGCLPPDMLPCPWDLDNSGSVGTLDLLALLAAWGTDPGGPPDFDGDTTAGILDLLTLLANWGMCR